MGILNDIQTIGEGLSTHQLTQTLSGKLTVLRRMISWQLIKKKYAKKGRVIHWVNDCMLCVYPGRAASTGNYYYGLMEYEPMSFCIHYCSEEDVVYDIGANIGVYTIICKAVKQIIAFEPADDSVELLKKNVKLNKLKNVTVEKKGMSEKDGEVTFTKGLDSVNHIVDKEKTGDYDNTVVIHTVSLDSYVSQTGIIPTIMKVDTEGAEESIICGGEKTISDPRLNVIIMEICGDDKLSHILKEKGFSLYSYDPGKRKFRRSMASEVGRTGIFIRDIELANNKVRSGKEIVYCGKKI